MKILELVSEICRVIAIWISGYLFASGLLLSYPHNPIWWTPSVLILALLLIGSMLESWYKKMAQEAK